MTSPPFSPPATAKIFEQKDVVRLLREEVERAGGQVAWSKKTGVNRTNLNRILKGERPPSKAILDALKPRVVVYILQD
jgi:DNA-binding phage protein